MAQGLLKSGHTVEVFERDADLDRKQGYYLHFNAIGGEALRRVLPDDLFELYRRDLARVLRPARVDRARRPVQRAELAAAHGPAATTARGRTPACTAERCARSSRAGSATRLHAGSPVASVSSRTPTA